MAHGNLRKVSKTDRTRIVNLYNEGRGVKKVAAEVGISKEVINRVLREEGVQIRESNAGQVGRRSCCNSSAATGHMPNCRHSRY